MTVIKAIHASARSLGMDEDTLRDLYERETHKRSLKVMTSTEQSKVLSALRASGAKPTAAGRQALTGPYAKKLQALWISAWNLGIVRNRDDKAMLAFIERQTGIQNTAFLRDPADVRKAVEALKSWIAREAGVAWTEHEDPRDAVFSAQCRILGEPPVLHVNGTMTEAVGELALVAAMNLMGERIRATAIAPSDQRRAG